MKLGNHEIKLYYSNWAVLKLTELCGGLEKIGTLFRTEDGESVETAKAYSNVVKLVTILANANIIMENSWIASGLEQGEKRDLYDEETMSNILDMSKASEYIIECLNVMGAASKFEMPDGMKFEDSDEDLEEILAEQNP